MPELSEYFRKLYKSRREIASPTVLRRKRHSAIRMERIIRRTMDQNARRIMSPEIKENMPVAVVPPVKKPSRRYERLLEWRRERDKVRNPVVKKPIPFHTGVVPKAVGFADLSQIYGQIKGRPVKKIASKPPLQMAKPRLHTMVTRSTINQNREFEKRPVQQPVFKFGQTNPTRFVWPINVENNRTNVNAKNAMLGPRFPLRDRQNINPTIIENVTSKPVPYLLRKRLPKVERKL